MHGPSPSEPHPMAGFPQVGFLKPLVKNPNIVVVSTATTTIPKARNNSRPSASCTTSPSLVTSW